MKLALAQMKMSTDMHDNLHKSVSMIEEASRKEAQRNCCWLMSTCRRLQRSEATNHIWGFVARNFMNKSISTGGMSYIINVFRSFCLGSSKGRHDKESRQ